MDGDGSGLEFVPTQDLLNELMVRFDASVFSGVNVVEGGHVGTVTRWYGNMHTCLGLNQQVNHEILEDISGRVMDGLDPDDEEDLDEEGEPSWS